MGGRSKPASVGEDTDACHCSSNTWEVDGCGEPCSGDEEGLGKYGGGDEVAEVASLADVVILYSALFFILASLASLALSYSSHTLEILA